MVGGWQKIVMLGTSFLLSAHSMRVFVPMNSYSRESFFWALMDCTTQSFVTHVDMTSGYFNLSLDQLSSCPWSEVVILIASLSLLSSLKYPIAFMVPSPTQRIEELKDSQIGIQKRGERTVKWRWREEERDDWINRSRQRTSHCIKNATLTKFLRIALIIRISDLWMIILISRWQGMWIARACLRNMQDMRSSELSAGVRDICKSKKELVS